jgi:hypothetical protein
LQAVELGVPAAGRDQLGVAALLGDPAVVQNAERTRCGVGPAANRASSTPVVAREPAQR